ncbi:MAG: hypothetical protein NTV34_06505 [Proteobacteria bacterium]|nr:hypothetical protein [Pseudomonadota bacterium]
MKKDLSIVTCNRSTGIAIGTIVAPGLIWAVVTLFFGVKSLFPPNLANQDAIKITSSLIGTRFLTAGLDEEATRVAADEWKSASASIRVLDADKRTFELKSLLFTEPVKLTYNGFKWAGYTHKTGRKMPIKIEIWP